MTSASSPPGPAAAPAATPANMPFRQALPYFLAAVLIGLSQGLGQGFITANIPQIAGDLGISTTDASWLTAAYIIPRASLPLLLIKLRTQFGLRRFTEVGILAFCCAAFLSLWTIDFRSALITQFLSGAAAAPLSTLAFLYMLEPLSPPFKLKIGLPAVLTIVLVGPHLARVLSPALIGDGGLAEVHLASLGLALLTLAVIWNLPLRPAPREKVLEPADFLSFALLSSGFAGVTIASVMGPIYWWFDAWWIGALLALAIVTLILAVIVELSRKSPMIDFRWLASPAMLHLTLTLVLFRIVLSEQSTGAPRMFQVLGVAPAQMETLFIIIAIGCLLGGLACVAWMLPSREAGFHAMALVLIACGAWLDSQSTVETRPAQMYLSQGLIGMASMLFMPPAMMMGLIAALRKGPSYLLSFIIVFIATQSLGGVVGSGLFSTLTNQRQAFHLQTLTEQLAATEPVVQAAIRQGTAVLSQQSPDLAADRLLALQTMVQNLNVQAWVMAYNDAYFVTFLAACTALALLLLHVLRDILWQRSLAKALAADAAPQAAVPQPPSAPSAQESRP